MSGLASLFLAGFLGFVPELALENTNIAAYDKRQHTLDVNRLRADITLEHEQYSNLFARLMVDNTTRYFSSPDSLQNATSIYRGYVQYRGAKNFWSIGRQRIPLGVGRIWNPIDVFNPINSQAIEPEEREGIESIRYEYAFSQLVNLDATVAQQVGAVRLKGFLDFADVALVALLDERNDTDIIGWELEGELFETGIELRSEGGSFHDRTTGNRHTGFIIGAEYGFASSLTLLTEYSFSDVTGLDHFAIQTSYAPGMLARYNLLLVRNLDDQSGFIAPSIEYSLSDEMTLSGGAFFYYGKGFDEFSPVADRYYLRLFIHF
jgi:hypothetical protein